MQKHQTVVLMQDGSMILLKTSQICYLMGYLTMGPGGPVWPGGPFKPCSP